jgi:hypothetical protein
MKSEGMAMKAGAFIQLVIKVVRGMEEQGLRLVRKCQDSLGSHKSHTKAVVEGK